MRTINHSLVINAPEEMHKLCKSIIGKYLIATIRCKDGPLVPEKIMKTEKSIQGHIKRLQYNIEEARYHLTLFNACLIDKINQAEKELLQDVRNGLIPKEGLNNSFIPIVMAPSHGYNPVFFEMDATFQSLVRTQNRLVKLIHAIRPLRDIKSKSLHNFIDTTIKNNSGKRLDEIGEIMLVYWNKFGKQIKDYRDMIEHNEHVKYDFRYTIRTSPSGNSCALLLLPDNPEVNSLEKLQYDNEINAEIYLNEAYKQTVRCIGEVLSHLNPLAVIMIERLKG